jgi:nucleotide-binding universal stress UspA family protein
MEVTNTMKRIMVGVDASPASVEALQRAAEEARQREASLEVVYVFSPPEQTTAWPVPPEKGDDKATTVEEARAEAYERLGQWLEEIDVDLSGIDLSWTTIPDSRPARALVERSENADLVVVGSRGRDGFAGLKLGSVSEQVARHAKAPVLIVR